MLFDPYSLGLVRLRNRMVMAPMTRNRALLDNLPNAMMAEYYAQRASMGLIITEGTAPAADGAGYVRIPGIYNAAQVSGWRLVTDEVHARDGKIFVQLMHTGRASHVDNLPAFARVVGPTAAPLPDPVFTDTKGLQPASPPHPLTPLEVHAVVAEYALSAMLAIEAGFDGVELHAANGYLIEQFLNANINTRTDAYGRTGAGRNRFALEVAQATASAIGAERVGMRISPYGVFNGAGAYDGMEAQYLDLVEHLRQIGLAYLHLVDHSSMGAPPIPPKFRASLRNTFRRPFIASGGFDLTAAETVLKEGKADLVAFGRLSLANPDLAARFELGHNLNVADPSTFYTPGEHGYIDYPAEAVASRRVPEIARL